MVHRTPFTIRHFGANNTVITYDHLHDGVFYHSPITCSVQRLVKLYAAWANRG